MNKKRKRRNKGSGKCYHTSRKKKGKYRWRNMRTETHTKASQSDGHGYIYCGSLEMDDLYKIGHAVDPSKRERSLRAANPRYRNLFTVQTNFRKRSERIIHIALRKKRVTRELFKLNLLEVEALHRCIKNFMWINKGEYDLPNPKKFKRAWEQEQGNLSREDERLRKAVVL